MRNNRYEGGECATMRRVLVPGDRVLELGAGLGLISTVAAGGLSRSSARKASCAVLSIRRENPQAWMTSDQTPRSTAR